MTPCAYIVACVGQKLAEPAPAQDLYISPWFRAARAYVETTGKPWFILSALHGLLEPGLIVPPYERRITHWGGKRDREQWGCREIKRLRPWVQRGETVAVLAGKDYVEAIWRGLRLDLGLEVQLPLQGLGIGQQLAWLKRAVLA